MKRLAPIVAVLACAMLASAGYAAPRLDASAHALLIQAFNTSVSKGWLSGQGSVTTAGSSRAVTTITFHGSVANKPNLEADLAGKLMVKSGRLGLAFSYHVIISGPRGASKIGPGHYKCFTKPTIPRVAADVTKLLSLLRSLAKSATVTSGGNQRHNGAMAAVLKATVKTTVSMDFFTNHDSSKSPRMGIRATLTFWVSRRGHVITGVSGAIHFLKIRKTVPLKTMEVSASFDHYGQAVAITMPKKCP